MEKSPEEKAQEQEKMQALATKVWYVLIPVFALVVLWRLYDWSRGEDHLAGILSPLGMIFIGLATITGRRHQPLYYLFLALGMISVVAGLILIIAR
jgi:hypothetical protein